MVNLGESFPGSFREDYSKRIFTPGSVFRAYTDLTTPPKVKIFVILSVRSDLACVGSLFVNSEININYFPTPALRDLNLSLSKEDFDFLDHDSFLDCSQIKEMRLEMLYDMAKNDPGIFLGGLDNETLMLAINTAREAPTIAPIYIRRFL